MKQENVICPYCSNPAALVDSAVVYSGRSYGPIWLCDPCKAWVGCHKGTTNPLGRLADATLRKWKQAAHAAFDPLWKAKFEHRRAGGAGRSGRAGGAHYKPAFARLSAYKWLADQMGIDREDCHIGMFDIEQCQKVMDICIPYREKLEQKQVRP